jgi:hypothetical protein
MTPNDAAITAMALRANTMSAPTKPRRPSGFAIFHKLFIHSSFQTEDWKESFDFSSELNSATFIPFIPNEDLDISVKLIH